MSAKTLLISVAYIISLIIVLVLLDIGLDFLFNNVMFGLLDWFNSKKLWFKLILLLIGGMVVVYILFSFLTLLSLVFNKYILGRFPANDFSVIASFVISLINAIVGIVELWKIPPSYNFWIVAELLLLSYFILHVNYTVVMRYPKGS